MHFGRKKKQGCVSLRQTEGMERTLALFGLLISVLFLASAFGKSEVQQDYPLLETQAAVAAFREEYGGLATLLGIDEYFPPDAQAVGAFTVRGEEAYREYTKVREWCFADYLRDAFKTLFEKP